MSELLRKLAHANLKGRSTSSLYCDVLDITYSEDKSEFSGYYLDEIEKEMRFRMTLPTRIDNPHPQLIQTIKELIDFKELTNVIDWYTDVFVHQGVYTFRCPLHKDDHPSGHIYRDARWHCFQCEAHGDVLDAVTQFGKMSLFEAIGTLSRYLGLANR